MPLPLTFLLLPGDALRLLFCSSLSGDGASKVRNMVPAMAGAALLLVMTTAAAAPSPQEAARFLTQATFGPDPASVDEVVRLGYEGWLDRQFQLEASPHRTEMEKGTDTSAGKRQEVWWRRAVTAPDQLRQRVAFALSEILVVSDGNSELFRKQLVLAEYYDTLLRGAFGNYRTLLEEVTLAPAMGVYLSMIRNNKPDPRTGRRPDENFAREVMQLFSIGLWQLNPDGTPKLDGGGRKLATYDEIAISNFARAYTGWGWADGNTFATIGSSYEPMKPYEENHDIEAKTLLNGQQLPPDQSAAADLKGALDNLFSHPNVGPFIAQRLIQRLVSSNPSPAYVRRVAQVFDDNGNGVRGDLRAVTRAVLLDVEARAAPMANAGKLREPLLRLTAVWRAFSASSGNGEYRYDFPERHWGQAALRSPSVFNFFAPEYRAAGAITAAGLYSPEFQIQTESRSVTMINAWTQFIRKQAACGEAQADPALVVLDVCAAVELSSNPPALVDALNQLMLYGQMSAALRQRLLAHLEKIPAERGLRRATEAIFLIAISPQFSVQH